MILASAYNRGSLIDQVTNQLYSTTGKFSRQLGRLCIALSSGQNITYAYTGTVYGISLYIKKRGDTTLVKDGSTTKVSITSGAIVATGSSRIFVDGVVGTALKQDTWQHVYIEYSSGLTLATNYKIEVSNYTLIGNSRLHTLLTDSEIANEYEYFQSLTSPVKATHFKYKVKANQLKDGLVWSAYRAKGQTIIDEISGNNAVRSAGFIDGINKLILRIFAANLNTPIILNRGYTICFRLFGYTSLGTTTIILSKDLNNRFLFNSTTNVLAVDVNSTQYQISNILNLSIPQDIIIKRNDKVFEVYVNGILNKTTTISDANNVTFTATYFGRNINTFNLGFKIYDLSIYNVAKDAAFAETYHNQFSYVTLHETFENNAVGAVYGDPYLTNARPTVSELTTAQYGYEVGKKYLNTGICYTKQDHAFGVWTVKFFTGSTVGNIRLPFIVNKRNDSASSLFHDGYLIYYVSTTSTLSINKNASTLASTTYNILPNTFYEWRIERTTTGVKKLYINDVKVLESGVDLTYTTSKSMLLNGIGNILSLKHTAL